MGEVTFRKPPILAFQAQFVGSVEFICPHCTHVNTSRLNWRSARTDCERCRRNFLLGGAFFSHQHDQPPFNGWYCDEPTKWVTHTVDSYPAGRFNPARLLGRCRWFCSNRHPNASEIDWDTGGIVCMTCDDVKFVAAILYKLRVRQPLVTPLDWILPFDPLKE